MRKRGRKNEECTWVQRTWKRHDRVNREALWQVLRTYDGKVLNGIKSTYANSIACFKINSESEVDHVTLALQCIYGRSDEGENGNGG